MQKKQLNKIYCHLIKGLRPEEKKGTPLVQGRGLAWDRNFAFKHTPSPDDTLDVRTHPWVSKRLLLNQHDFPELAQIEPQFDSSSKILKLIHDEIIIASGDVSAQSGRDEVASQLLKFVKNTAPFSKAYHPQLEGLVLLGDENGEKTFFADGNAGPVSLVLEESFSDLQEKFQYTFDPRSFRINLHICGAPAWSENDWRGKKIKIGNAVLQLTKPIGRCPNIDVHPETGERTTQMIEHLKEKIGHTFVGMRSEVVVAGHINVGDSWEPLD